MKKNTTLDIIKNFEYRKSQKHYKVIKLHSTNRVIFLFNGQYNQNTLTQTQLPQLWQPNDVLSNKVLLHLLTSSNTNKKLIVKYDKSHQHWLNLFLDHTLWYAYNYKISSIFITYYGKEGNYTWLNIKWNTPSNGVVGSESSP